MNPPVPANPYKRHRFPSEIMSHGVWCSFHFCLSDRDVEEMMTTRGVILTYEAVGHWCQKFGRVYANQLRRRCPRPREKWHLDEVFLTINSERYIRWRAVGRHGHVLTILRQRRRDKTAAKRCFRPGSLKRVREWAKTLHETRRDEALATLRDETVIIEANFLDSTSEGDFLIAFMKAESFEKSGRAVEVSTHDLDRSHQQFKKDTWESRKPLELLVDLDRIGEIVSQ